MTTIEVRLDEATVIDIARMVASELGLPADSWLNVEQAASYLACPPSRIYDLVQLQRIQFARDGRRLLFRRAWLDAVAA